MDEGRAQGDGQEGTSILGLGYRMYLTPKLCLVWMRAEPRVMARKEPVSWA